MDGYLIIYNSTILGN